MNRKERMKALERMAQAAGTTSTTSTTSTTGTQGAASAAAPPVQRSASASTVFPSITVGWDSSRVVYVNKVVGQLDAATSKGTSNKYNFQKLWDAKFPAGAESEFTSPVKDLLVLFRKVFMYFLNNGVPFQTQLNAGQVTQRVNVILSAPEIAKFEQVDPNGPLGQAGVSLATIRQTLTSMLPANASK
jgi:hypothetical protein